MEKEQNKRMEVMKKQNKGITLIALVITIIVLLILAGVTIATLTGDNGLLQKATNAQKLSDIGEEKEIIGLSVNQVKAENLGEELTRNIIDNALNKNSKENNKARVTDEDEGIFIITFDSQRTYTLDISTGKIDILERKIDNAPGNIKVGINGETLAGNENSPYEIWSIEDLVELSVHSSNYAASYIKLMQDLDFNSNLSYTDGKMLECNSISELKDKLTNTNGEGFTPISFWGVFDGQKNKIDNIYIKKGNAVLFYDLDHQAVIKNLKISGNLIATSTYGKAAGIFYGNNATIINCVNNAKITSTYWAGGIVAYDMNCKIYNCINNGEIKSGSYAGGIASSTSNGSSMIYNCFNVGKVTGNNYVGGISRWCQ